MSSTNVSVQVVRATEGRCRVVEGHEKSALKPAPK